MLLLEFGSDRDMKSYSLGLQHPDPQVRDIFREHQGFSPRKTYFINVGRSWAVEGSSNVDCVFSPMPASLSRPWNERSADTSREWDFLTTITENMIDNKAFPVLDPSRPSQEQQQSATVWDSSKVKKSRETLPVIESSEAKISSTSLPVETFPKLIGGKSPHPLESAAQLSWRDFRNPTTQLVIEEACTSWTGKIQGSRSQIGQAPRKKRWQSLQLK